MKTNMDRPKILIVDDEPDVLKSTRMLLDRLGYDAVAVEDADQLPRTAEREKPDLILQDLLMPGFDVGAVLRALRKNPRTSRIPVILFSASAELQEAAAQSDAVGFLAKPFGERELLSMLGQALGPKAAPPPRREAEEDPAPLTKEKQREAVRAYFHDYWNTLTALTNYSQYLVDSATLRPGERDAAQEISRLVLDLERKTDALRAQLLEYVG